MAGAAAVLAHDPHDRPEKLKKGPAPLFHAATAEMRQFLWSQLCLVLTGIGVLHRQERRPLDPARLVGDVAHGKVGST